MIVHFGLRAGGRTVAVASATARRYCALAVRAGVAGARQGERNGIGVLLAGGRIWVASFIGR